MIRFVRSQAMPASVGLILAILLINSAPHWWSLYTSTVPAIKWIDARVLTPVVAPGETLKIAYRSIVNKQCPSELRTFILAADGSSPVRFPPLAGGYSHASDTVRDIQVSILIPLEPDASQPKWVDGEYIYRTTAMRFCGDSVQIDNDIPDVAFRLAVP